LQEEFDLDVIIPEADEREYVHQTIFSELCQGQFTTSTRQGYLDIIENLHKQGAEGVILGCTEIPLLLRQEDTSLPLFNTTALHAAYALEYAFSEAETP